MAFYDHFAFGQPTRIGLWLEQKAKENEYNYLKSFLPDDKNISILEIGPGKGLLAIIFMENGYKNYDIVEPNHIMNKNMIEKGVRKAGNYFIPRLQENDNSYDLIIATHVFEHLNDAKEADLFISEAKRVLRKEGMIFIVSPDYNNFKNDFFNCDYSHNYVTTLRRTMQIFANHRLRTLGFKYTYSCFQGMLGALLSKIVKLATFWCHGNSIDSKPYNLRLTFSKCFAIAAIK